MSDHIQRSLISPAPPLRNQHMGEFVWHHVGKYPNAQLLVDADTGASYTGAALLERAETVALHLMSLGVKVRDVVTLYSTNSNEMMVFILAAFRLGATVALLNAMAVADDVKREVTHINSSLLFTDTACGKNAIAGCVGTPVKNIIINGSAPGCISLSSLETRLRGVALPALGDLGVDPVKDVSCILFSSGTTGLPKAVLISHQTLMYCIDMLAHPVYSLPSNYMPVFQPLAHIMGLAGTLGCMLGGEAVVIIPKFTLEGYIQLVVKHKVKQLMLVPPITVLLAKSGLLQKYDLSCVEEILNGSAPLSEEVSEDVKRQLGGKVYMKQAYGLTETCAISTVSPGGQLRHLFNPLHPGTVGMLAPGVEGKIVDPDTGKALPAEQEGELCIRTPCPMLGYLNNPKATAEMIDKDGWLHTGDVGFYDANGCWYVVDRFKELIKYKGNQVSPSELENVLLMHPAVADAGVVGMPDDVAGELPTAWVVLKPQQRATETEIADFVAGKVSQYKKLRGGVRFVQAIPKSPSGKILRRFMKDAMVKEAQNNRKAKL